MTISTSQSQLLVAGNGMQTAFTFNFVGDSASVITVSYIDSNNVVTPLTSSQYTLTLNPATTNQLWGIGGQITYPIIGSPIATGTYLLIQRTVPYQQNISISNQGNFYPQVVEQAMDLLEMQIQQVAARTTQFRGIWTTNTVYYYGDIVQDGPNGANTKNYYICQVANTSGTWSTDLNTNGYWTISVLATVPSASGPTITLSGDVSGSGATSIVTTIADSSVTNAKLANMGANTVKVNNTNGSAAPTDFALAANTLLGMGSSGNIAQITLGTGLSMSTDVLSASSSGMVLLNTINISNGATSASFSSTYITNTYNKYVIEWDSLTFSTGADLYLTISTDNGSNYLNSNYIWVTQFIPASTGTPTSGTSTGDAQINITGGATSAPAQGRITFAKPSASAKCVFLWEYANVANGNTVAMGGGGNTGTTAINNIKFAPSAGSYTGGTMKLYGLS